MKIKTKHRKGKTLKANKKAEIGFDECDIIAAQNGDSGAWYRIRKYFTPYMRMIVYKHRPGYTAHDYRERQNAAESALLEAVMKFTFEY